jgi:uncharacterized protein
MLSKSEILSYLEENRPMFADKYHLSKLGLFGSYARNDFSENSDIDIIIEFDSSATHIFQYKYELREILKQQFKKEVDLCREKSIRSQLKPFILKDTIYV